MLKSELKCCCRWAQTTCKCYPEKHPVCLKQVAPCQRMEFLKSIKHKLELLKNVSQQEQQIGRGKNLFRQKGIWVVSVFAAPSRKPLFWPKNYARSVNMFHGASRSASVLKHVTTERASWAASKPTKPPRGTSGSLRPERRAPCVPRKVKNIYTSSHRADNIHGCRGRGISREINLGVVRLLCNASRSQLWRAEGRIATA